MCIRDRCVSIFNALLITNTFLILRLSVLLYLKNTVNVCNTYQGDATNVVLVPVSETNDLPIKKNLQLILTYVAEFLVN